MGKDQKKRKIATRFLGTFELRSGESIVGELRLKGSRTLLKLHSDEALDEAREIDCVKGVAYTGEYLTLIDCNSPGTGHTSSKDAPTRYHADVFPHYVAVGRRHLQPAQPCISAIQFTTTDLTTVFYDFDAFGSVFDAKPIIDTVLQKRREIRPVEAGDWPHVLYFTGKDRIAEVATSIGKVKISHQPRGSAGGPRGVSIKNRIVVSIEPSQPATFQDSVGWMYEIACFLSMAAGRAQGIDHIQVTADVAGDDAPQYLSIHPSFPWKASDKSEQRRPHPGDVPLDPIRHRAEFDTVLADWVSRHSGWRVARLSYLNCLRKGNNYGPERLVAAANMFDILPEEAVPLVAGLPEDLASTRDACVALFRKHPTGIDRNGALDALGRLGKPSLPKKVGYRVAIVESKLADRFPHLLFVSSVAIKCRNFYVHGSSGNIDFRKVESLMPFLTDALEFIFAASDFIEAGWDAQRWAGGGHGWGHSFSRFYVDYGIALAQLQRATSS